MPHLHLVLIKFVDNSCSWLKIDIPHVNSDKSNHIKISQYESAMQEMGGKKVRSNSSENYRVVILYSDHLACCCALDSFGSLSANRTTANAV
jgi:hypothetical protein